MIEEQSPEEIAFARDQMVLNAVFRHYLEDREEHYLMAGNEPILYVHMRNPDKIGILDQTDADVRGRKIPSGLVQKLIERNRATGYDAKLFSLEKFHLDKRVKVVNVDQMLHSERSALPNYQAFEKSKGFFNCFAPAYSDDGTFAVVRAWVGPSYHGGTVTYLLKRQGDNWVVQWREFTMYV